MRDGAGGYVRTHTCQEPYGIIGGGTQAYVLRCSPNPAKALFQALTFCPSFLDTKAVLANLRAARANPLTSPSTLGFPFFLADSYQNRPGIFIHELCHYVFDCKYL